MMRTARIWLIVAACAVVASPVFPLPGEGADAAADPTTLAPESLDALIAAQPGGGAPARPVDDDAFLRRASFDLIGRQPTLAEQREFASNPRPDKYRAAVERLLASDEFAANWANYWSDTIAYRVPPPELTYLDYGPLKKWLAAKLAANAAWSEIVRELIIAKGKVGDVPAATFVGYHNADPTNLAGETSRIFLGQQIGCAQCHDHPFDRWQRTQFHELAAFFARVRAKLPHNYGAETLVTVVDKGEYLMPNLEDPAKKGSQMQPAFLDGTALRKGQSDDQRRTELADWITSRDNPWFAKAFTNRIWARLLGRGFYEPVDDLGDSQQPQWSQVHDAVAAHFTAGGHDIKDLFRLVANSEAYRRGLRMPHAGPAPLRLRGDEVFAALSVGIDLPNVIPPKVEPTDAIRFPPPPKSTRDLVNDAFGADPSLSPVDAPRTMGQALWMMNNQQLHRQIDARPGSGTMLAGVLADHADDRSACEQLYRRVLSRRPTEGELSVVLEHVAAAQDRGAAFEDLLWSLVNSAEFTSRR